MRSVTVATAEARRASSAASGQAVRATRANRLALRHFAQAATHLLEAASAVSRGTAAASAAARAASSVERQAAIVWCLQDVRMERRDMLRSAEASGGSSFRFRRGETEYRPPAGGHPLVVPRVRLEDDVTPDKDKPPAKEQAGASKETSNDEVPPDEENLSAPKREKASKEAVSCKGSAADKKNPPAKDDSGPKEEDGTASA